jgi:hypothetical protein
MKLFFSSILLVLILVSGCSPKQNYTFAEMDDTQVKNFIVNTNHIKAILYSDISDFSYGIPSKGWVENKFTDFYKNFLFKYSLNTYKDGKNNCNKYSQYAITCGHILFKDEPGSTSLAIGQFSYFTQLVRHSIIFFIVNDDGHNKLLFYEPQAQQFITLTDEEIKLCTDWKM